MNTMIKKYPVRDYLSVETRWKQGGRHAVGMPPLLDASLRDAVVGWRVFSTERYIPNGMLKLRKQSQKSHVNYKTGHTDYKSARADNN